MVNSCLYSEKGAENFKMEHNYVIGTNGELYHYGVLGMKWGVRRYQHKNGSLTAAGKKRLADKAGRYLDPDVTSNTAQRQIVASQYKKFTANEETIEKAESFLYSYASATLRDMGLKSDPKANAYVADLFREDPNFKALSAARDKLDAKREKAANDELSRMTREDQIQAKNIVDGFGIDRWGSYTSSFKKNISGADIEFEVHARKGTETYTALSTVKFMQKYDLNIAKEGIAKEYYDGPYSWVSDPSSDNYYTRSDFKNKVKPSQISIDPNNNTYDTYWDDGGTYGYHTFVDEGSLNDMKVRSRSLNG